MYEEVETGSVYLPVWNQGFRQHGQRSWKGEQQQENESERGGIEQWERASRDSGRLGGQDPSLWIAGMGGIQRTAWPDSPNADVK